MNAQKIRFLIESIQKIIAGFVITLILASSINAQYFEITSPKIRLWADHIVVNRNIIEARGDVYIRNDQYSIFAEFIHIHLNQKEMIAQRSVLAQFKDAYLSGDRLQFNLDTQTGMIDQGTLFYEPAQLYIKGNKIKKTGKDTYDIDKIQVTGCDICDPDWSISGNNVHITIDGYARLWHGTLSVKNTPILYMPYFIFPVKLERQTGLLFPFVEHSSRKGWLYQQRFYWAIGKSYDATFFSTFMEKRGIMNGLEFRYNTGPQSQGTFMIDYLDDRQQETVENQNQWGYPNDDYLRRNAERYWIRSKIDRPFLFKSMMHLDLDRVSDPDFLKTFDSSYTGFDKTLDKFFQRHHRDIDDADENFRLNRLMLDRRFEQSKIYGEIQWVDDVYHANMDENESPIQKLPMVRFSQIQAPLWHLPIFFDIDSLYAYNYQKNNEKKHNFYMASGLTCPLDIFPYFFLEQSFRWKGGYSHSHSPTHTAHQNTFKTCITSELYKIYSFGSNHAIGKAKKEFKHSIRLVTDYTHVSDIDDRWKSFRFFDEKSDKINWLLSNTWVEKIEKRTTRNNSSLTEYKQRVKLTFSGDYDILQESEGSQSDKTDSQAFSPIKMDFVWNADLFSINADALWPVYENDFYQHHFSLEMDDQKAQRLKINYQYCEDKNESMDAEISVQLHSKLKLQADYEHDIHHNQRIQHGLGFEYKGPCWCLIGMFNDNADTNDQSVSLMVHLDGISN